MSIASFGVVERQAAEPLAARDMFVTLCPRPGETLADLLGRAAAAVQARRARILSMTLFNGRAQYAAAQARFPAIFGPVAWPITQLQSEAGPPDDPAGVAIHALVDPAPAIHAICLRGRVVGNAWEDEFAQYCVLGDLRDDAVNDPAPVQTRRVLQDMVETLRREGMTFRHVYRTWFRNRDILAWYREFNQVRTEFFNHHRVFDGPLPASTGISAGNPHGAALVAGLWAMLPKSPLATVAVVDSPLQDSACRYGSSFSRAVEVRRGALRHLTVSGTASIGRDGKTLHVGDIVAQTELTMQVVRAILQSRGMDWADVAQGLVYCRHRGDVGACARWGRANGVTLPVIEINHTVCRDDLLYEIELDAQSAGACADSG